MQILKMVDRATGILEEEHVFGGWALRLLYEQGKLPKCLQDILCSLSARSFFSKAVSAYYHSQFSKRLIEPFITKYGMDTKEFAEPKERFKTFNDFFIRKLTKQARPIDATANSCVLPADARYRFYANASQAPLFTIKGHTFSLETLLGSKELAQTYQQGSIVIARLAPPDYHRFHFPTDGIAKAHSKLPGPLYSVNPLALNRRSSILQENRREITLFHTQSAGTIAFVEIGATCVGAIHQTYQQDVRYKKGEEKGYFSFGGSAMVLLFEKDAIKIDQDLLDYSQKGLEVLARMGERFCVY